MADDVNPTLRAEIGAAIDVIGPQIDGLRDMTRIEASDAFVSMAMDEYNAMVHRESLLWGVMKALDAVQVALAALEGDGYPAVNKVPVPANIMEDVRRQKAESDAAYALFEAEAAAANLAVSLGAPSTKPRA